VEITVTNVPPPVGTDVPAPALALFRRYLNNEEAFPYEHQAAAMKKILAGENLLLVAGTAAGKTLAVAVPLFCKLTAGQVQKIMFLYPTVALLEDQRRVMDRLAALAGLADEVGQIRGGLSRSRLLRELNKKIILATPDAVYWFFRKNIKYSHLLIYGLAQVDELVMDEAHLFHGLVLQNLGHFLERIFRLQAAFLGRVPARLHILTATPREELRLLGRAPALPGKSKCGDVRVTFLNCGSAPLERAAMVESIVQEAIAAGAKKILVICNSALQAHRIFHRQSSAQQSGQPSEGLFRPDDYLQFGRMKKEDLEKFLAGRGFPGEVLEELRMRALEDVRLRLDDFQAVQVKTDAQEICRAVESALKALKSQLLQVVYLSCRAFPEGLRREVLGFNFQKRHAALPALFNILCPEAPARCTYPELKKLIEAGFGRLLNTLEDGLGENFPGYLSYPDLPELSGIFKDFAPDLRKLAGQRFLDAFTFSISAIISRKGPLPGQKGRFLYLKFLPAYFPEHAEAVAAALREELSRDPSFARLIEMSHVAVWRGTDYPLIVYSGSMSRRSRQGLINLFDGLEKAVLLSTAAVEVGVDFAAEVLVTEECPAQAFLQRFGRVGRTGGEAKVYVLTGGAAYGKIADRLKNYPESPAGGFCSEFSGEFSLSREEFTDLINESFRANLAMESSDFIAAAHYLVTEQLGRTGKILNEQFPVPTAVQKLATALKQAEINPAYGLRGTLPQISLQDEGVGRDPFYLLQYVPNGQLEAAASPFEIAAAGIYFTNLLFTGKFCRVGVDVETTLENATAVVVWTGGEYAVEPLTGAEANALLAYARRCAGTPRHKASALLFYGDIYLARIYEKGEEGKKEAVADRYGQPLVLPEQFYLLFPGRKNVAELAAMGLREIAELHYDVDQEGNCFDGKNLVLLERVQGACLALYKRWLEYAG